MYFVVVPEHCLLHSSGKESSKASSAHIREFTLVLRRYFQCNKSIMTYSTCTTEMNLTRAVKKQSDCVILQARIFISANLKLQIRCWNPE